MTLKTFRGVEQEFRRLWASHGQMLEDINNLRVRIANVTGASVPAPFVSGAPAILENVVVRGVIYADIGDIGGWNIGAYTLTADGGNIGLNSLVSTAVDIRIWAGNKVPGAAPFRVDETGALVAANANITGIIHANNGDIGGWNIGTYTITADEGNVGLNSQASEGTDIRIWAGHQTPSAAPFRVDETGALVAANADITGNIDANTGHIGDLDIDGVLTVGTGTPYLKLDGPNKRIESSTYASGISGMRIKNNGDAEFNNVYVRGALTSAVFVRGLIEARAGSMIIVKSAGVTTIDTTLGNDIFDVVIKDPPGGGFLFSAGDRVRIKSEISGGNISDTWGVSSAGYDEGDGTQRYTIEYRSGTSSGVVPAGAPVLDYGASGSGGLLLTADIADSPFLGIFTHAGSPWTAMTQRVRIGNLDGISGVGAEYGLWTGQGTGNGDAWVLLGSTTVEIHNIPIKAHSGTNVTIILNPATPYISVGNPAPTAYGGDGFWAGNDGGTYKLSIGNSSGGRLLWNGSDIYIYGVSGTYMRFFSTGILGVANSVTRFSLTASTGSVWIGDSSTTERIQFDSTNGMRIFNHSNQATIQFTTDGNAYIQRTLTIGASGKVTVNTDVWLDANGLAMAVNTNPEYYSKRSFTWFKDSSPRAYILGYDSSVVSTHGLFTMLYATTSRDSSYTIMVDAPSARRSALNITVYNGSHGNPAQFNISAAETEITDIYAKANTFRVTNSFDVGATRSSLSEQDDSIFLYSDSAYFYWAGEGWANSAMWMKDAYPVPVASRVDGTLSILGNTKHALNGNQYGRRPIALEFIGCGGRLYILYGDALPNGSGINTNVVWSFSADFSPTYVRFFTNGVEHARFGGSVLNLGFSTGTYSTKMTAGLKIDQSDLSDHVFEVASSLIAHGMTALADTEVFGYTTKYNSGAGGLSIVGLNDGGTPAAALTGCCYSAPDETTAVSSHGIVELWGYMKSGTTVTMPLENDNLLVVRAGGSTRFIFKAQGNLWLDGIVQSYDEFDDALMCWDVAAALSGKRDYIPAHSHERLEELGVVAFEPDGHPWMSIKGLWALSLGAHGQTWHRVKALEDKASYHDGRLEMLEKKVAMYEKALVGVTSSPR